MCRNIQIISYHIRGNFLTDKFLKKSAVKDSGSNILENEAGIQLVIICYIHFKILFLKILKTFQNFRKNIASLSKITTYTYPIAT